MSKTKFNVYVIGRGISYGRWIPGQLVSNMEDADVVVLTGGEDIHPKLYGEPVGRNTYFTESRDDMEVAAFNKAKELGKPIWGTCRGAQLLCAMAGGKLIQHMEHHSSHSLTMHDDNFRFNTNTLHHQMQYPFNMDKKDYHILAYSEGLSRTYQDGRGQEMEMPEKTAAGRVKEPEFVYYPAIKGLGIQGHPEMMSEDSLMVRVCTAYLTMMVNNKLDDALVINLAPAEILRRAANFRFTSEERQFIKQVKKQALVSL